MTDEALETFLEEYRKAPGTQAEKYDRYWKKLHTSERPAAVSLVKTLDLLTKGCEEPRAHQVVKGLAKRRYLVVYGPVGTNHGALVGQKDSTGAWGTWDGQAKQLADGVIVVSNEYEGNWIMTACVLAHEFRHILDVEETALGRLDIGIVPNDPESLNQDEPQRRANITSGAVAQALGFRGWKLYQQMTPSQVEELKGQWGERWWSPDGCAQIDYQMDHLAEFQKQKPHLKAQRCGRPCDDFERYGYCDRYVYFPPCWDH